MTTARAIAAAATATALAAVVVALLAPAARAVDRGDFPPGFLFGAATSAYQIEGAYLEDGKGLCNWDVFTHTHTRGIKDGRNGDVADDHYHRYMENYQAKQGGSIGIVTAMKWYEPLTNSTEDILAARRAQSFETDWFLDPIFFGDYPRAMREILQSNLPTFTAEEKKLLLRYKVDFIGLNHYTAIYAKDCIQSPCNLQTYEGNAFVLATGERDGVKIGRDTALAGFYDVPEAIEPAIMYVNGRYKDTPVYITENGFSQQGSDANREELINDVARKNYLQGYVTCLSKAVRNGANVRGYFVWTLLDNFEWTFGYSLRFGLYHVDFDTQERTPRMSASWYRGFLTGDTNTTSLLMTDEAQARRADS